MILIFEKRKFHRLIEDDDLLQKYNTICDKVSADVKKEFGTEPTYNKKILENVNRILQ